MICQLCPRDEEMKRKDGMQASGTVQDDHGEQKIREGDGYD